MFKTQIDMMRSFCGSQKLAFSSLRISGRVRLVPSLLGHTGGMGDRSWSAGHTGMDTEILLRN